MKSCYKSGMAAIFNGSHLEFQFRPDHLPGTLQITLLCSINEKKKMKMHDENHW